MINRPAILQVRYDRRVVLLEGLEPPHHHIGVIVNPGR
jgi:hypothetical protein